MTKKEFGKSVFAMRKAGRAMRDEREDFSFGEWAGESEREVIESVTGHELESFTTEQVDELLEVFLIG